VPLWASCCCSWADLSLAACKSHDALSTSHSPEVTACVEHTIDERWHHDLLK